MHTPPLATASLAITDAHRPWRMRVFTATWLSYFGFYICRKPYYAVKGPMADELGWDAETLGYLGTAYLLAYAAGQFIAGFAGDKLGPRILLLTGMGTTLTATALFGVTNSLSMFMLLMVLQGLAQATGWSGNVGAMASWFHKQERGTVLGWWGTCYQAGGFLGTMLAAYLLGRWGYQTSFFGGALVMLGVWTYFLWAQRDCPGDVGLPPIVSPEDPSPTGDGEETGKDEGWTRDLVINVALIGMFYFFVKFIRYALWSWAPYILYTNYSLQGDDAAFVSTIFDIAGIAGVIGLGMISDRVFAGRRVAPASISIALLLSITAALWMFGTSNLTVFVACMGLIGFSLYGPDSLMAGAGAIDVGGEKKAVLCAGLINGMGSLGSVAQELLLGKLLDDSTDLGPVFALLVASASCALFFMGALLYRNRTGRCNL